jgi:sec-independent protein translocase protein TatB
MDNIFGVGLPEFVLIMVIAGMVMGPERIARAARTLGVMTARLQAVSRSFFRQINAELDSVDQGGQLRDTVEELNSLKREVTSLRNEVFTLATGAAAEGKQTIQQLRKEVDNTILPPDLRTGSTQPRMIKPERRSEVYRPSSLALASDESSPTSSPATPPPVKLPKRVDVDEDPDV